MKLERSEVNRTSPEILGAERLREVLTPGPNEDLGDPEATLERIARVGQSLFGADFCIVFSVDPTLGPSQGRPAAISGDLSIEEREALSQFLGEALVDEAVFLEGIDKQKPPSGLEALGFPGFAAAVLQKARKKTMLAVLGIGYRQPHAFSPAERVLFRDFIWHASRQLQNALFARRDEVVDKIGEEINEGIHQPEQLFSSLRAHAGKLVNTRHCLLLAIYEPATRTLDVYIEADGEPFIERGRALMGACKWVIENQKELLIEHLSEPATRLPTDLVDFPIEIDWEPESLLFVPLVVAGECLGVLSVQHPEPRIYDHEDQRVLELVANQVGLALNNFHLFEGLRRLNELGQILNRNLLEPAGVIEEVVERIREATSCDVAVLFPYLQATESFEAPCYKGTVERPEFLKPIRPDDVAVLALRVNKPTFAVESRELYALVGGDPKARRGNFEEREGIASTAALPLRVSEEAVGVLFLSFRNPQRFSEPQKQLISGLANYAAIAIKNSRVFGAEGQRHTQQLEVLQSIDRELGRTAELRDLLATILRLANDQVKAEIATILLYNPKREELRVEAAAGENKEGQLGTVVPLKDRGITLTAFKKRESVLVDNVRVPEWAPFFFDTGGGTVSELDVPMLDAGEVVGILNFESPREGAFHKKDLEFLQVLAGQAVLAVKKAQAYEIEKRLAKERGLLIDLGKELTETLDRDRVMELIVRRALEITNAHTGVLALLDSRRGDLVVGAELGNPSPEVVPGRRLSLDKGVIGLVARKREKRNIPDVTVPAWNEIYWPEVPGMRSELAVPLSSGGVLSVESSELDHFQEEDERLLETLADFAVIAIQNAQRYQEVEKRRRRLTALHKAGNTVLRQFENPERVMHDVVRYTLRLTDATDADLDLYEGGALSAVYHARADSAAEVGITQIYDRSKAGSVPPPLGIVQRVAETLESYRTTGDAQNDTHYRGDKRIRSELAVPLFTGAGVLGVLNAESEIVDAFDEDDQEVLELFAAQAMVTIENVGNYARAERERKRFALLHKAGQQLGQISGFEQLDSAYDIVLRIAEEQCDSQVVVRRYDQLTDELVLMRQARHGGAPLHPRISADHGLNGWVARKKITRLEPNVLLLPEEILRWRADEQDLSFIVAPIQLRRDYYGNLALSHHQVNHFQKTDVELIEGLCQQLAITIHRLDMQEAQQRALENQAITWIGEQAMDITHRLGNDLGLVKDSIRWIRAAGPLAPQVQSYLDDIESGVLSVLDMSTSLANRMAEQKQDERMVIPVRELVKEAVDSLRLPPDGRTIELAVRMPEDLGEVYAVHGKMISALLNLLVNAIEAMPQGGVLTVGAENDGSWVRIGIQDTGRGIAQEDIPMLFRLYYTTKKSGSAGWGLARVRKTVEEHGGSVKVDSEVGRGSTFTLILPLANPRSDD